MNTNLSHPARQPVRSVQPTPRADIDALYGEYAGLAQHPCDEDDRLALAIRVFEVLRLNEARPA